MFKSVGELEQAVARLRLVEPEQLQQTISELRSGRPEDLLQLLEKTHLLTSYQTSVLGRGRTDGLVLGGYKLLYKNASGSFARIYRGCAIDDGRMVGLKVLRDRWARDPRQVAQFRREAELCMRLRHTNIVPIYDVGSENGFHYFAMEFVEGGNLRDFVRIRGKLSPAEATRTALDMTEGLEYALSRGMTHRDLKPTNVLMSTQGVAKLVDFGLAGDQSESGPDLDGLDRALEYATLERGTGARDNDPRSDLFFLGAIYYELLAGVPAWPPTRSREERKKLARYTSIRPLRSLEPNVPRSIADIVERLMKTDPHLRYQTPTEVLVDLRAVAVELGGDAALAPRSASGNGGSGGNGERAAARSAADSPPAPAADTVMFIEHRVDQQDVLRDYFSKRGFRVLVLSDPRRGLNRLKTDPPDCIVLMGRSIGDEIPRVFREAQSAVNGKRVACIAVLSETQADLAGRFETSPTARVLVQPIKLRDLRSQVTRALKRSRAR